VSEVAEGWPRQGGGRGRVGESSGVAERGGQTGH